MNADQSPNPSSLPNNPQPTEETPQPSLVERVASLEASNKALAEVVNSNGAVMRDCFEVTEARQWMIMRVLDDMSSDGVPVRDAGGAVDWEHYKTKYFKFQEELRAQAVEAPAPENDIPADAVVFGGNGG
jgi:hypothetical protein